MLEFAKDRAQSVPGSSDLKSGRLPSGDPTATEVNTVFNQASQKFEYAMLWVDNTLIVTSAKKMYQLNQQFLNPEQVSRLLGASGSYFPQVSVQDLAMNPDFIPLASQKTQSTQLMVANLMNGVRVVSGVAAPWTEPVLRRIILELFAEWRFQDLEEFEALMQQAVEQAPPVDENGQPVEGQEFGQTGMRRAAPAGTGRQDRRTGQPISQRGLAKALSGVLSNQN